MDDTIGNVGLITALEIGKVGNLPNHVILTFVGHPSHYYLRR